MSDVPRMIKCWFVCGQMCFLLCLSAKTYLVCWVYPHYNLVCLFPLLGNANGIFKDKLIVSLYKMIPCAIGLFKDELTKIHVSMALNFFVYREIKWFPLTVVSKILKVNIIVDVSAEWVYFWWGLLSCYFLILACLLCHFPKDGKIDMAVFAFFGWLVIFAIIQFNFQKAVLVSVIIANATKVKTSTWVEQSVHLS